MFLRDVSQRLPRKQQWSVSRMVPAAQIAMVLHHHLPAYERFEHSIYAVRLIVCQISDAMSVSSQNKLICDVEKQDGHGGKEQQPG